MFASPTTSTACGAPRLRGFITDVDLPEAELVWPGLHAFLTALPAADRPDTFLDLVWRFETAQRSAA